MTSKSKRELLDAIRPRYLRAKKAGKELMLDEFCAATHYHRKYAIRLLKHGEAGLSQVGSCQWAASARTSAFVKPHSANGLATRCSRAAFMPGR